MSVTQLETIKAAPYLIQNILSLFTVFPLAISLFSIVTIAPRMLNNRFLMAVGCISYEIYLVHVFLLELIKGSAIELSVFILVTIIGAFLLRYYFIEGVLYGGINRNHSKKV